MKRFILAFALILSICISLLATTVERLSLDDMVRKANSIVHGTVRSQTTHWSSDGRLILTTTTIDVAETIKGPAKKTVELTTIGGQVGDRGLFVSGMPSFEAGEEAVIFIENSGAYSIVVGLSQGKFAVKNGEVANTISNLAFADGKGGGAPLRMRLEDFKRQIQSRLHQ